MVFTQHSDVYTAINEEGLNRIIVHMMKQRPSLFNYATHYFKSPFQPLCATIEHTSDVATRHNPLFSIIEPLKIPGTEFSLNYCMQLKTFQIDFYPRSVFALPPELAGKLEKNKFAIKVTLHTGFGCPPNYIYEITPIEGSLPIGTLECSEITVIAIGRFEKVEIEGEERLAPRLDEIEIVDVRPEGLENSTECTVKSFLIFSVLSQISIPIKTSILGVLDLLNFEFTAAEIPPNPKIEENELRLFIDVEVS